MKKFILIALLLFAASDFSLSAQYITADNTQGEYFSRTREAIKADTKDYVNAILNKDDINALFARYLPDARVERLRLNEQDGVSVWEGKLFYQKDFYEFKIDAKTGRVIEWRGNGALINNFENIKSAARSLSKSNLALGVSTKQFNEIISKALPGAALESFKYNKKLSTYTGVACWGSVKYKFEIDAKTCRLLNLNFIEN